MADKQKERVQFDFSSEALQRLDDMKTRTGAATRAEVVRNALRLYEWFVSELEPENTIKVFDQSKEAIAIFKAKMLIK
jgi:metal-responsive CopG/Arc/MetJ family transcriptional regulator